MASILIADDDQELAGLIHRALESSGHDIVTVADGSDALAAITAEPNRFTLLISDVQMPGMDGVELAQATRNQFPGIKVLLMTGDVHERETEMVQSGQVAGMLEKPFTLDVVRDRVAALVS